MNAPFSRNCNGVGRRDFLQLGLPALTGLGMMPLTQLQAKPGRSAGFQPGDNVNCILIWLDGGPSHYETFDPKPDAPKEIRGEFGTTPTSIPGVHFSEHVPKLAKMADKFSVVRSICHNDPNHGGGNHYLMTGRPTPVPVNCGARVTFHPSFGSVVSHHRGLRHGMPAYMSLPQQSRSGGPYFLGAEHSPFVISSDPNSSSFRVRDVVLPKEISEGRASTRRQLRQSLDRMKRYADKVMEDPTIDFDNFYAQGIDLIGSPKAQEAFDISSEDAELRDRYGRTSMGQRMLLARRLVEVGVSFVTVYYGGWDHHEKIFPKLKDNHLPQIDDGVSALIADLEDRGMLETTLVLLLGEFGRTPKINNRAGRDHWPNAMSVLMAGAGVPGGTIVGATDSKGYYASENMYSPEDFAATLYTKMGIDPHRMYSNHVGRPTQLVNGGRLIKELFM